MFGVAEMPLAVMVKTSHGASDTLDVALETLQIGGQIRFRGKRGPKQSHHGHPSSLSLRFHRSTMLNQRRPELALRRICQIPRCDPLRGAVTRDTSLSVQGARHLDHERRWRTHLPRPALHHAQLQWSQQGALHLVKGPSLFLARSSNFTSQVRQHVSPARIPDSRDPLVQFVIWTMGHQVQPRPGRHRATVLLVRSCPATRQQRLRPSDDVGVLMALSTSPVAQEIHLEPSFHFQPP